MDNLELYALTHAGGGDIDVDPLSVTENGTYTATDCDGYSPVTVNVPTAELEQRSVTITQNGTSTIEPSTGKDGMSEVEVTVSVPQPSGSVTITENGTYDVTEKASAVVNVSGGGTVPTKGFVPTAWDSDGYVMEGTWYGDNILRYAFGSYDSAARHAFAFLTNISMPDVTSISDYAFRYCLNFTLTELPSGVTSIGSYAFRDCKKITSIILPSSINTISTNSFGGCSNLLDIYVPWAQGEIKNAPWGATNASIHYSWTPTT